MALDELKKLSPGERLKKLKELQAAKKKEIEEAQALISASEEELAENEKTKQDIPIDQLKADDAGVLFGEEEREMFEAKRFVQLTKKKDKTEVSKKKEYSEESVLEEEVAHAPMQRIDISRQYQTEQTGIPTSAYDSTHRTVADLYAEIRNLYETTKIVDTFGGRPLYERSDDQRRAPHQFTDEQRRQLYELEEEARAKQEAIQEGNYTVSEAVKEQLDLTTRIMKYMR